MHKLIVALALTVSMFAFVACGPVETPSEINPDHLNTQAEADTARCEQLGAEADRTVTAVREFLQTHNAEDADYQTELRKILPSPVKGAATLAALEACRLESLSKMEEMNEGMAEDQ